MSKLERRMTAYLEEHLACSGAPVPEGCAIYWRAFADLSLARGGTSRGPLPIPYGEILAWCQLMRCPLEPHQVRVIVAMDRAWIRHAYAAPGPVARAPISPGMFDAILR